LAAPQKQKRGLWPRFRITETSRLQRADVGRLQALRAGLDFEFHALVFSQALETLALDFGEVGEQVVAAAFRSDEAEALGVVEPLDGTGLSAHLRSIYKDCGLAP